MRFRTGGIVSGWVLIVVGAGTTLGQADGYSRYTDWQGWARTTTGERAGLASSFDRAGGNYDFSQYESPAGLRTDAVVATVKTIEGPGVVERFWMPHLTAKLGFAVRMYFDGETTPRIATTSAALLSGSLEYFSSPLVTTFAGGQVSYEPIPFAASLRIETENKVLPNHPNWSSYRHYYQYSYRTFSAGTIVDSYTGTLSPAQQASRAAAADLFANAGQHPAGDSLTAIQVTTPPGVVPAGESLLLGELAGPGLVRRINLAMPGATDTELDGLLLRVSYDGDSTPAISAGVGDFFGAGHGRADYRSLPLGTDSPEGFYSYWPMPFHRSVRIWLENLSSAAISVGSALVEYERGPIEPEAGYLHAVVNRSIRSSGTQYHPILSANGRGHYVGNLIYLRQATKSFALLEGDEVITVDGSNVMQGTGLEDAYNGGYYFNWVGLQFDEPEGTMPASVIRPLCGVLHMSQTDTLSRSEAYRWMIADRVPFMQSINVKIENIYSITGAEWATVAFYYLRPQPPGDLNGDFSVDVSDVVLFQDCATGPEVGPVAGPCHDADFDDDGDVDQSDFGVLQRCFRGAGVPADPRC